MKSYRTIAGHVSAEHEIKKSRFIGEVFRVRCEEEALARINEVKEAHKTARHHVYAYRLYESNRSRYTDDGEPALTAGIPTLNVLEQHKLHDILAITVRYFGGTLLGTGGLVRAYTKAVTDALTQASIVEIVWARRIDIVVNYALYERVLKTINHHQAQVLSSDFGVDVHMKVALADDESPAFIEALIQVTNANIHINACDPCFLELELASSTSKI